MELRGQDKDLGIQQNSFYYNQPQPQTNQESPSKLSSTSVISTVAERRRSQAGQATTTILLNQTLDQSHLLLHHQHQLNPHQQQTQRPEIDPNPDPDPSLLAPEAIASPSSTNPPPQTTQPPPPLPPPPPIRFRECLKNHAAAIGGHAVDGCGEFMPGGEDGTAGALKCAACDCHRNFHRKEVEGEYQSQPAPNSHYRYIFTNTNISPKTTAHHTQFPPPQRHQINHSSHSHRRVMLGFGGSGSAGAPADSSSEDLNLYQSNSGAQAMAAASKKRFRTKFSQEQRDGMQEFAERLGWKIQKQDEEQVEKFCDEMGVKRRVFKVWMHNNKQAMKKKNL